jgi:hypothetical protein
MRYDQVQACEFSAYTYVSIPQMLRHLGIKFKMTDESWVGEYNFHNTRIWDSARRLEPNMYRPGAMQCLSFGWTKPLQLGKAGAILTDDVQAYRVFSRWRSDGRDLRVPWQIETDLILGWHYCPTLETCAQGIQALMSITPQNQKTEYPDCRKFLFTQQ